jgi:hypothetical protein
VGCLENRRDAASALKDTLETGVDVVSSFFIPLNVGVDFDDASFRKQR